MLTIFIRVVGSLFQVSTILLHKKITIIFDNLFFKANFKKYLCNHKKANKLWQQFCKYKYKYY